jgi:hypothetical protein
MTTKYPAAIILALSALLPACKRSKNAHTVGNWGAPSASLTKVAGLSLALPGQLQKAEFGLSKSSKENTAFQDSYVMQSGSTQYGLCQTVHYAMNDSLDENAHGIVDGHTEYSIVDMQVAGVSGKRIRLFRGFSGSDRGRSARRGRVGAWAWDNRISLHITLCCWV